MLVQIERAMAEAVRRSGAWIACRVGCTECCLGPFEITESDVGRLREGMAAVDRATAARIRGRAEAYVASLADENAPCPALDPDSGRCELYEWRPVTCRTFGPAVRVGDAVGACELCYAGATDEEIAGCAVELPPMEDDGAATAVAHALLPAKLGP